MTDMDSNSNRVLLASSPHHGAAIDFLSLTSPLEDHTREWADTLRALKGDYIVIDEKGDVVIPSDDSARRHRDGTGGPLNPHPTKPFGRVDLLKCVFHRHTEDGCGISTQSGQTPRIAKLLLLFVPKQNRECLLGDLEEEFNTVVLPEYGCVIAQLWYWEQALFSFVPVVWEQLKRVAGIVALIRFLS